MPSGELTEDPPSPPPGASCYICLEEGADDDGNPLLRNCACRGSAGYGHVSCVAEHARRTYEQEFDKSAWDTCPNCKQKYVGNMSMAMANAFVESVRHLPETDIRHFDALQHLAQMRLGAGDEDGVQELFYHLLDVLKTRLMLDGRALEADRSRVREARLLEMLAITFAEEETMWKAIEHLENARRLNVSLYGPQSSQVTFNDEMLNEMKYTLNGMHDTGGAVRLASRNFENAKRKHGKEHQITLFHSLGLASALRNDGKFSEAIDLMKDTQGISRRVLGAAHPNTKEFEDRLSALEAQHQASRSVDEAARSRAGCVARQATIIGHPNKSDWNGKQVKVTKATKDGKFIVSFDLNGKPTKFKAAASNLVFAEGTPALIHGLVSRADLNGKRGEIESLRREEQAVFCFCCSWKGAKAREPANYVRLVRQLREDMTFDSKQ